MSQRWLSHYPGRTLSFNCYRCKIHKRYDVDQTLAKMGDHNLKGMSVVLAEAEGCPRVFTTSTWDVCGMSYRVEEQPPNELAAMAILDHALSSAGAEPAGEMRFDELSQWQVLYACCRACGRVRPIDRKLIPERHAAKMMREISLMLKCRCGKKGRSFFAVAKLPR